MADALHRQEVLARTAAHDLAHQLGASLGYVSMLADDHTLSPESQAFAERAVQQLTLMQPLLDDLQSPQRPLEPERVPVERLIELLSGLIALRGDDPVVFRLDVPPDLPDVWCERVSVMRVFYNLLVNAIRHNADVDGLEIWVCARRAGQAVEFEVGDSGTGIAPDEQAQLFEFGYQADSTGKVKGHGLGLWSCRRIIEAHGGRIWAESRPGQGARFFFTLVAVPSLSSGRNGRLGGLHGIVAR
jgi:signal transduction histidine kinase